MCVSYNPFESLHIDHIGPLPVDDKGNSHILVMIDAFSRWVELYPTKTIRAPARLPGAFSSTLVDSEHPMLSDSWEPYKALMHVDKLHDYLHANAMKTLIPREHK